MSVSHDDVIKWKHFPRYWPFVRGIHRLPVNSPHKGQWRRALMLSLICTWTNGWVNNRDAGDFRRHRTYYDVILMIKASQITVVCSVCPTVGSGADQRKHQSSASLAFVWGIHWWPVNSPHKRPVTRNMFPFNDIIMHMRWLNTYPCHMRQNAFCCWYHVLHFSSDKITVCDNYKQNKSRLNNFLYLQLAVFSRTDTVTKIILLQLWSWHLSRCHLKGGLRLFCCYASLPSFSDEKSLYNCHCSLRHRTWSEEYPDDQ